MIHSILAMFFENIDISRIIWIYFTYRKITVEKTKVICHIFLYALPVYPLGTMWYPVLQEILHVISLFQNTFPLCIAKHLVVYMSVCFNSVSSALVVVWQTCNHMRIKYDPLITNTLCTCTLQRVVSNHCTWYTFLRNHDAN